MLKISKNIVLIKKSLTQGFISSIKTKKTDSISTRFFNTQNPYIRLGRYEKPIGTLLLFLPCTWGIALGAGSFDVFNIIKYASLFGFGSTMLRSAGCAINDLWDQDFDKNVERTKKRPLASGDLTQIQAIKFIIAHLFGGLCVLTQLNMLTIGLSFAIMPIVISYPLAKRFTNYPQIVLGLAFNWGIITGYTAIKGIFDYNVVIPAYIAGITWTLIYDTIYAHQDKNDDIKIGVKSTALTWSKNTKKVLKKLNIITFSGLALSGYYAGLNLYIFYPILGGCSGYLYNIIRNFDSDDPNSCNKGFLDNKWFGIIVFGGIVLSKLKQKEKKPEI